VPGIDDRQQAVRPLLEAAAAACDRRDWRSAIAIAEAAAALDPDDPAVAAALARARAGASPGTRRRLTVMFCDLAGSTEIASVLDPEDTREILHAYYETCAAIVRQHDGHVARLLGDGVLIYFGYPQAHEDDALRAVLTALAIAEAVSQLRSPARGAAWDLRVRIGIHTGLAVISDLGSGASASAGEIVGETPNLAARVQTAAPTGSVVISADTLGLVRDRVEVESLGAHSLKGINRPIELFRVVSVRPDDEDEGTAAPWKGVAVGRKTERTTLERAWQEASQRSGYVVIAGEPGIGKSHLVRYARGLVAERGRSLVLRCSALHSNTPLHPVAQLLLPVPASTEVAAIEDPVDRLAGAAEAVGLASEENLYLLALMSSVPWPAAREVPDLQPAQARERTLTLLCSWFDALASEGPLLLVIEDLHWADPSTLDLLRRYVTEPRPHPILVLVTTRLDADTVPGEPTAVISLQALDVAECDELIDKLTEGRLDQATRAVVAERGDRVPLYVRELATMLDAEDAPGSDQSVPVVPPTLNGLLVARLDSFPGERDVVEALAVLGRPAAPELVAEVIGRASTDVQQQLELLEKAGILRSSPAPSGYDFHHALLRDAAYDVQLLAHRRGLHRRAAEALEAMYSISQDDRPQELAHHYRLAGEIERAVSLWMRVALQQASFAAHAEAIQSFELVLDHLPDLDRDIDDLELRAQSGVAASLLASRGYTAPEVAAAYGRVRELSAQRNAELEVSSLYGLWAYYHVTGNAPASLETAQTLVERAAASGDDHAGLAARAVLGYQLQRLGRPTEALPLLQEGRRWDSAEPLLPHHPGIGAGANLAMTHWLVGDFAAARKTIECALTAARALEGPTAHFTRAYTHAFAAELFQVAGQPDIAAWHAGRAVGVSGEFGFASWLAAGMTNLKIAEVLAGDLDATATIEYCLKAWRDAGATSNLTQFGLGLALAYRAAGRTQDALATIDLALQDASDTQELYLEPELHRLRGELLTELAPDDDAGSVALGRALASAVRSGSRALELRALVSIERRHRDYGSGRTTTQEIDRLLGRLDPLGQDPEPLLVDARACATVRFANE
jgi:class 3 adenylate cyclase/tetratricopeptide (TPR) repeat protein